MHLVPHPTRRVVSSIKLHRFATEILLLTLSLVLLDVSFSDSAGLAQSSRVSKYAPTRSSREDEPKPKKNASAKSSKSTVGIGFNFVTPDHNGGVWLSGDAFQLRGLLVSDGSSDLQMVTVQGVPTVSEPQFVSRDIGWMTDYRSLYQSVDGGISWSRIDSPVMSSISCLHFKDVQNGWVGGLNGEIYRTTDGGQTWKKHSTGLDYQIKQVFFVDLLNGWADAYRYFRDSVPQRMSALLKTADGGETWEIVSNADTDSPQSVHSLLFLNPREGWAIDSWQNNIVHTEDGGKTWKIQQRRENRGWNSLTFINDKEGWAAGDDGIIHTADGGQTWEYQVEPESSLLDCYLDGGITFVDKKKGWAVCRSGALRTTDGGDTWKPISKDWIGMVPPFETLANDLRNLSGRR